MEQRVVIHQIEDQVSTGRVFVVFWKQVVNGERIISSSEHRITLNEPVGQPADPELPRLSVEELAAKRSAINAATLSGADEAFAQDDFPKLSADQRKAIAEYL